MRIYHPKHGIVFTTDQAEIDRLISKGGSEFDVNDKLWQRKPVTLKVKEEVKIEVEQEVEQEPRHLMHPPKRGRPTLSVKKSYTEMMGENITLTEVKNGNN